ncbi:MAG: family 10 glycosylhydrolase [Vicinamibacterales bacterium]
MLRAARSIRITAVRIGSSAALLVALLLLPASHVPLQGAVSPSSEVRGLWVLRTSLTSRASIERTVRDAAANGFNTLFVQVRGRGDAYYLGGQEPVADAVTAQPGAFDPLATVLALAHPLGLRVHAWMNISLVASARTRPTSSAHVMVRHPDWLMVPRELARELAHVPASEPAYAERLAQWTRGQVGEIEGLYVSPILPEVAEYDAALVGDLVKRYRLDGVHLDYVRYPSSDFDYGAHALTEFRETVVSDLSADERERLERRYLTDPLAYVEAFPLRWSGFRRTRLTALVMKVRAALKAARPEALLSAAVIPNANEAVEHRLQDWSLWLDAQLLDVVCPMIYTPDAALFRSQLDDLSVRASLRPRIWAGIGAYRLTPSQTVFNIRTARDAAVGGVILFSYDSVVDPARRMPNYLSQVSQQAFSAEPIRSTLRRHR